MTYYEKMYSRVFEIIGELTPLKGHDCGELCGAACCSGGDGDGMLLFPGEETSLAVTNAELGRLAVCSGRCCRCERPLSCRIFPFFPMTDADGRVRVGIDSRARHICPIAAYSENVVFDRRFIRAVGKAGRMLARDEECRAYMQKVTAEIETLEKFF